VLLLFAAELRQVCDGCTDMNDVEGRAILLQHCLQLKHTTKHHNMQAMQLQLVHMQRAAIHCTAAVAHTTCDRNLQATQQ
jgi:hypothetical protein